VLLKICQSSARLSDIRKSRVRRYADEYIETIERRYIDRLSVDVMEMRVGKK
jgi:hypothetical protein